VWLLIGFLFFLPLLCNRNWLPSPTSPGNIYFRQGNEITNLPQAFPRLDPPPLSPPSLFFCPIYLRNSLFITAGILSLSPFCAGQFRLDFNPPPFFRRPSNLSVSLRSRSVMRRPTVFFLRLFSHTIYLERMGNKTSSPLSLSLAGSRRRNPFSPFRYRRCAIAALLFSSDQK